MIKEVPKVGDKVWCVLFLDNIIISDVIEGIVHKVIENEVYLKNNSGLLVHHTTTDSLDMFDNELAAWEHYGAHLTYVHFQVNKKFKELHEKIAQLARLHG